MPEKVPLKLAIVGGGRACKFFLKLVRLGNLPYLDIDIIGVCDINPRAEGLLMAQQLGIYTTDNFKDLFDLKDLDGIVELTNNREVLVELIRQRPERIGIIEHNISRLLRDLFTVDQKLRSAERQIVFEKAIRDFLIQQNQQCIVVINTDFTIDAVNDAYLTTVSKTRDEVIGAHCYQVIHGLESPCDAMRNGIVCPMLETLRTGQPTKAFHSVRLGSQQASTIHDIVTFPVRNAKGEIIRVIEIWMGIGREIASRWEKREQELKSDLNKLIQEDSPDLPGQTGGQLCPRNQQPDPGPADLQPSDEGNAGGGPYRQTRNHQNAGVHRHHGRGVGALRQDHQRSAILFPGDP